MKPDRLFRIFHALAGTRFPGDADDQRFARLTWLSSLLGRTVASSKTLSPRELKQSVDQLMREVPEAIARKYGRAAGGYKRRHDRAGNVVIMPNRGIATKEQLYLIAQLEQTLGWAGVPERLSGFLRQFYHCADPRSLSFRAAGSLIESLFAVAARDRVKARLGADHPVSRIEITAEVAAIKRELHQWQPPPEAA